MDDDNYLNPKPLLDLLSTFTPDTDVYIGKPSLDRPMRAVELLQGNKTVSIPLCPLHLPTIVHFLRSIRSSSAPLHRELKRGWMKSTEAIRVHTLLISSGDCLGLAAFSRDAVTAQVTVCVQPFNDGFCQHTNKYKPL